MKKSKENGINSILVLQIMNVVYSLDSVLIKLASDSWKENGLFSSVTICLIVVAVGVLGGYAILWQTILSRVKLSIAYLNRGMVVFWGMIWSVIIFHEHISVVNIIGCAILFAGFILVNKNE